MLPTIKTPPKSRMEDLSALIYGPSKFGKSTFCANIDQALFLATEPGLNHLEVFQMPIQTWQDLLNACGEIAKGDHPFTCIVLDTVDHAYRLCVEYVCAGLKITHPSDLKYGKGYAAIYGEFTRVLNKLALLPYGLFLISHAQEKEVETRTGNIIRHIPTLPDKARQIVTGMVDLILYGSFEAEAGKPARRVLHTKPSPHFDAGDRTGRLPATVELDFPSFLAAWQKAMADGQTPRGVSAPKGKSATAA